MKDTKAAPTCAVEVSAELCWQNAFGLRAFILCVFILRIRERTNSTRC